MPEHLTGYLEHGDIEMFLGYMSHNFSLLYIVIGIWIW